MMKYRKLGKTEWQVSEVSLGTWQVGGKWGSGFDDSLADSILGSAIDAGINFIDTADVYESGLSEAAVGRAVKNAGHKIYLATKCGRQINPHVSSGYTPALLINFVENSLRNTGLECLDLIQLHCPPTEVYYRPEIFGAFQKMKEEGKIGHLGISVEKVEEALKGIEYDIVSTVQIIYNVFRQRPSQLFFKEAQQKDVGIIVRVPLASGLLTGKYTLDTTFSEQDHRQSNRNGELFDRGETFSGIPYEVGIEAVEKLREILPSATNLAPLALRWILDHQEVGCVIPGVSRLEQLHSNLSAIEIPSLSKDVLKSIEELYQEAIAPYVHHLW